MHALSKRVRTIATTIAMALAALALPIQTALSQGVAAVSKEAHPHFTVTVSGAGPDVILVPGLASSAEVWDRTVADLKATHRVHVIQVAGFAGAPAPKGEGEILGPLVKELADYAASLKKPAIIGHSMGGLAALEIAGRRPDLFDRVMVVDALPFYAMLMNPATTLESIGPQAAAMRDQMRAVDAATFAANQERNLAILAKSPDALAKVKGWSKTSDRTVVIQAFYDDLMTDARPLLPAIKSAVTVVYAYDAVMGAPAIVDGLYASAYKPLPGVQLRRVDGGYHFIMLDQPEAFAAEVARFLK